MARKPAKRRKPKDRIVDPAKPLTPSQELFAQSLALHGDNARAYRDGYKTQKMSNTAIYVAGSELSRHPKVALRVAELRHSIQIQAKEKFDIDANWLLCELAAIAKQNPRDYFTWGKRNVTRRDKKGDTFEVEVPFVDCTPSDMLTPQQLRAVASASMTISRTGDVVQEIKLHCKTKAIEKLCMHFGLLNVNLKVSGSVNHTVDAPALDDGDLRAAAAKFDEYRKSLVVVN